MVIAYSCMSVSLETTDTAPHRFTVEPSLPNKLDSGNYTSKKSKVKKDDSDATNEPIPNERVQFYFPHLSALIYFRDSLYPHNYRIARC